jgi:dihydrofolate reductase
MRELVLFIATSLDGYIAGPRGEIDWLYSDQDYGFEAFQASVDTVVMGRKTFEVAASLEVDPFPGKSVFVFTRQTRPAVARARYVRTAPRTFIDELRARPGGRIWLVGGGELVAECMRHDLIDAYHLFVHPVILGAGLPLFSAAVTGTPVRHTLQASGVERFDTGLVRLDYRRARLESPGL